MSKGFINGSEEIDLHLLEIIMNAECEDEIRDIISDCMFALTAGKLSMKRKTFSNSSRDDGTIYFGLRGGSPIGRNESKFEKNWSSKILGNNLYGAVAQAVMYLFKDPERNKHKFILISSKEKFTLIKLEDNVELINRLFSLYEEYPKIAPCKAFTTPNIGLTFIECPLNIYRSWDVNMDFRFTEVLSAINEIA